MGRPQPHGDDGLLGVWIVRGIRCTEVNLAAAENDVIVPTAVQPGTNAVKLLLLSRGVDDHQVAVAIFILERPQQTRRGIQFQPVVVTRHCVDVYHGAGVDAIFHHLAVFAVRAVGRMAISVPDENVVPDHGD